jgi:hypothetical protein
MVDWGDVLKTIGSTTVVAAFITWAVKALISQFLKRDLKSYEDQLKHASDLALEGKRNELKRETDLIIAGFNRRSQAALIAQKAEAMLDNAALKDLLGKKW